MESLHDGALLDWESRKIVKRIDVEIKNVSSSIPLSLFNLISLSRFSGLVRFVAVVNTFEDLFYILRFDRLLQTAMLLCLTLKRPLSTPLPSGIPILQPILSN